jgi:hypothetical protein
MSMTDRRELSGFEERLLTELKDVVRARNLDATAGLDIPAPRAPARSRRRRVTLAVAAATLLAGGMAAPAVLGLGGSAAYAVDRAADGTITVSIRDFKDAPGLERQLRRLGVNAVVDYVPFGRQCRAPRATPVPDPSPTLLSGEGSSKENRATFRMDPKALRPGQSVIIELMYTEPSTGQPVGMVGISASAVTGPVAPCVLVPGSPIPGAGVGGGVGAGSGVGSGTATHGGSNTP